jgi:PncC family amidohydrolase
VAEVGTGGYATGLLSNASNVNVFFKGGLISQQPAVLTQWGVASDLVDETKLVSKEVAAALATTARQQLASDVGLALAIVAGPADFGGKPAGTIIVALDFQGSLHNYEFNFRTKPSEVKRWAALNALNILRRAMLK